MCVCVCAYVCAGAEGDGMGGDETCLMSRGVGRVV